MHFPPQWLLDPCEYASSLSARIDFEHEESESPWQAGHGHGHGPLWRLTSASAAEGKQEGWLWELALIFDAYPATDWLTFNRLEFAANIDDEGEGYDGVYFEAPLARAPSPGTLADQQ